jgi:hypothetical protein
MFMIYFCPKLHMPSLSVSLLIAAELKAKGDL